MSEERDPYDGDYVGNIFGWKLSFLGLLLIIGFSAFAAYRHYTMDVPIGFDDPTEAQKARFAPPGAADRTKEPTKDSLIIK